MWPSGRGERGGGGPRSEELGAADLDLGGPGIYLIKPDTFGLEGEVVSKLGLAAPLAGIKKALAAANSEFAKSTEKKVYSEHVSEGRRKGKKIEMAMPYGEDRDGDGEIDSRGGRRGR